ncbi:hypothetical protein [Haloarchaeobius sp. DFWS5]|uniref:hypothetical protein n=1 Tax=Haloarchaeobius sp. DFWS5 TaxID=3446114 RepID=UPI003EB70476
MTDATGDHRLERIEQGLDALFVTDVATEILAAVDFEAILADEPATDLVDVDRLANAIGRPVGRLVVHHVVGGRGAAGLAKRTVGTEVGGRVAARTIRVAIDTIDVDAATETLLELDAETLPGQAVRDRVEGRLGYSIEESDVFELDSPASDATAGDETVIDIEDRTDDRDGADE